MRNVGTACLCAAIMLAAGQGTRGGERADRYGDPLPEGAVARLGTLRMRYRIGDLHYLPGGTRALVSVGGELHVWDLTKGERLGAWSVTGSSLRSLAVGRDGRKALVADTAGTIAEWDIASHKVVRKLSTGSGGRSSVHYSPDETRVLALDTSTSTVEEWDLATGKRLIAIKAPQPLFNRCIYGPGGTTALVAYRPAGDSVYHYDLKTGKLLKKFSGNYCVYDMTLSPDGKRLLTGQRSQGFEWRLDGYKLLHRFRGHHGGAVTSVAYTPDGRSLFTGSRDGSVRLWDCASGKLVRRWFPHQRYATRIRVSPDGKRVLTYGNDWLITETSIATGEPRLKWERHLSAVHAVAFTPDGALAVTGSGDKTLRVWRTADWQCVRTIENPGTEVHCLAVSPGGRRVVAGSKDGTVRELALDTGELRHTLSGHRGYVHAVAYLGDGTRVLSAAGDGTVRVWDVAQEKARHVLEGHLGGVLAAAASPDGTRALSGGRDGTVREWDLEAGRSLRTIQAHRGWVEAVAYGGDGRSALSAGRDGLVIEWKLPSWRARRTFDHQAAVRDALFLPDGKHVCSVAGLALVWHRRSGEQVRELAGHGGTIRAVAASPDGRWLITGSDDTTALVWELPRRDSR